MGGTGDGRLSPAHATHTAGGAKSPTLKFSGLAYLCSHQQGHLRYTGQMKCRAPFLMCFSWSRGQLPHHFNLSLFLRICIYPQDLNQSLSLSPIPHHTIAMLTLIVPICLALQGTRWACVFSLEPRAENPRPVCGSSCPTQFSMMLVWAMLPHQKDIIIVSICPALTLLGGSWLVFFLQFLWPQLNGMGWGLCSPFLINPQLFFQCQWERD